MHLYVYVGLYYRGYDEEVVEVRSAREVWASVSFLNSSICLFMYNCRGYGVATISELLQIIGLFCRISSLL